MHFLHFCPPSPAEDTFPLQTVTKGVTKLCHFVLKNINYFYEDRVMKLTRHLQRRGDIYYLRKKFPKEDVRVSLQTKDLLVACDLRYKILNNVLNAETVLDAVNSAESQEIVKVYSALQSQNKWVISGSDKA